MYIQKEMRSEWKPTFCFLAYQDWQYETPHKDLKINLQMETVRNYINNARVWRKWRHIISKKRWTALCRNVNEVESVNTDLAKFT
jgi:hypothetical protein